MVKKHTGISIKDLLKGKDIQEPKVKKATPEVKKLKPSEVPKFKTFEVKLSILLREDQLEFLEKLTREVMSNRDSDNKKERITKNTIIRVLIDILKQLDIDTKSIPDEEMLLQKVKEKLTNL